jgi:hypothetical protein
MNAFQSIYRNYSLHNVVGNPDIEVKNRTNEKFSLKYFIVNLPINKKYLYKIIVGFAHFFKDHMPIKK